ncbi:MAG: HAMP domain-containing histidine kinase [Gammaproteobacteria bacterium]|nr:HAMP domain-containing histidine kinase [Gammaproteobacteria bacterium]NND61402.1 HAMP domain-containing histidine kinase [Gammaproteobacteria bacterium]
MPRLFWKLFSAFWLTTVAILAISIFASFQLADQAFDEMLDPRTADGLVREQLAVGGLDELKTWVTQTREFPPGQTIYLLDAAGNDLLDRRVPEFVERRARRMWSIAGRERGGRRRMGRVIHEIGVTHFVAIPGPAASARFGVFASGPLSLSVLAIAAVISLVVFWLLARSLTRPVLRISETASRLAEGDMGARVGPVRGGDEIDELARQFDRMATQIEAQARQRHELFRNVSHELRAPLARLEVATELLERKPEQRDVHLQRIRKDIETLDELTGQVLALARATQSDAARSPVDVGEVVRRVVSDARFEASAREIQISQQGGTDKLLVMANEALLASAIENVVRNAIQHAPDAGGVDVAIEADDSSVQVAISDTGPGVPAAELTGIFEPFYRLDQNKAGAGIGLAITRRVIDDLGGDVTAANRAGGGLRVTMVVPRLVPASSISET